MKRFIRLALFAAVLCALLMVCSGAAALDKAWGQLAEYIDGSYFYEMSSLPEWIKPQVYEGSYWVGKTEGIGDETANLITVEFVSGDQELSGVISDSSYPGCIRIDGRNAVKSGKVNYSYHMESEHYYADGKAEVNVVSYEEMPLFTEEIKPIVINAEAGCVLDSTEIIRKYLPFARDVVVNNAIFSDASGYNEVSLAGLEFADNYGYTNECTVVKNGTYDLYISVGNIRKGNHYIYARLVVPLRINCLGYAVLGPEMISLGESVQYVLSDPDRKVTWSVEGSGASVDENGVLTADEGVPYATVRIVARVEEDGAEASKELIIGSNLFMDLDGSVTTSEGGFICPVYNGDTPNPEESPVDIWNDILFENPGYDYALLYAHLADNHLSLNMNFNVYSTEMLADSMETEKEFLEKAQSDYSTLLRSYMMAKDVKTRVEEVNGHWMLFITYADTNFMGYEDNNVKGMLICPRNWLYLQITFSTEHDNSEIPNIVDVMRAYAARVQYDDEGFGTDAKRAGIRITNEKPVYVTSGKSFALKVSGEDDEAMAKFVKLRGFDLEGKVIDQKNSMVESKYASINGLTVVTAKGVEKPVKQLVGITLMPFGSYDSLEFTIIPVATKVTAEPEKLTLYAGSEQSATVSAGVEPESIPLDALSWKAAKKGIIELTDNGDGTATVKALKAGQDTLTVTEPSGKKASVKVSVVEPVVGVELAVKGKAIPGGTVTVKETLAPKNAGNKTVEWSLDVDESIATVNKGKVKIAKTVPAGTVITVTCTALGAPEPVSASVAITVE